MDDQPLSACISDQEQLVHNGTEIMANIHQFALDEVPRAIDDDREAALYDAYYVLHNAREDMIKAMQQFEFAFLAYRKLLGYPLDPVQVPVNGA